MITEPIAAGRPSPGHSEQGASPEVASTLTELTQSVRTMIKQRPVVAVLAAVGVGYVIARLASLGRR
jgi:hypothetical protein